MVSFFLFLHFAVINILEFQPNETRLEFLSARLWVSRSLSVAVAVAAPAGDRLTHKAIGMVNFKYVIHDQRHIKINTSSAENLDRIVAVRHTNDELQKKIEHKAVMKL